MVTKKKTQEELEQAAHNRLKGPICFHLSSVISQLDCTKKMLIKYRNGCALKEDYYNSVSLLSVLGSIEKVIKSYQTRVYTKLNIGRPNYIRSSHSTPYPRKPYGTHK